MKTTITEIDFHQAFFDMNRSNNFSYEARKALFDFFEELEEDSGQEIELDVISICCDFAEYENAKQALDDHGFFDFLDEEEINELDDPEIEEKCLERLRDETLVLEFDGGIVIQAF